MDPQGLGILGAIIGVAIARVWLARDDKHRAARRAGTAGPTQWETPARVGPVSLTPGGWIIAGLAALVVLSIVQRVVEQALR